jgi:hypothetical protein
MSAPAGRGSEPVASSIPIPGADTTLSARTVTWLAEHPDAREVVSSVWTTLTELEQAGQHPGTLAALRFVLIHHQPPTPTGYCPTCRRHSWRQRWRRRRFPCVIWRQIRGELLGHLTIAGTPPLSTEHIIAQLQQLRELVPTPVGESHD